MDLTPGFRQYFVSEPKSLQNISIVDRSKAPLSTQSASSPTRQNCADVFPLTLIGTCQKSTTLEKVYRCVFLATRRSVDAFSSVFLVIHLSWKTHNWNVATNVHEFQEPRWLQKRRSYITKLIGRFRLR